MWILEIMCWSNYLFLNTAIIINLLFKILKTNKMKLQFLSDEDWCCFSNIFCLKWLKLICKSMHFCRLVVIGIYETQTWVVAHLKN